MKPMIDDDQFDSRSHMALNAIGTVTFIGIGCFTMDGWSPDHSTFRWIFFSLMAIATGTLVGAVLWLQKRREAQETQEAEARYGLPGLRGYDLPMGIVFPVGSSGNRIANPSKGVIQQMRTGTTPE